MNMDEMQKKEFLLKLGRNIKRLREEKEITLDELAKQCGYTSKNSRSTIQKIEAGKNDIPASKLKIIAKILGTTPSYIMGWGDENLDKVQTETEITSVISKQYGSSVSQAFNDFLEFNPSEREKISKLLSKYKEMDSEDRAEVRGHILAVINGILRGNKYSVKKESKIG